MSLRKKGLLESWKFFVYLTIPFFAVYVVAAPKNMRNFLEYKQYVVYPPEGPRPPTGTKEEVQKAAKELREQQKKKREEASLGLSSAGGSETSS